METLKEIKELRQGQLKLDYPHRYRLGCLLQLAGDVFKAHAINNKRRDIGVVLLIAVVQIVVTRPRAPEPDEPERR